MSAFRKGVSAARCCSEQGSRQKRSGAALHFSNISHRYLVKSKLPAHPQKHECPLLNSWICHLTAPEKKAATAAQLISVFQEQSLFVLF